MKNVDNRPQHRIKIWKETKRFHQRLKEKAAQYRIKYFTILLFRLHCPCSKAETELGSRKKGYLS